MSEKVHIEITELYAIDSDPNNGRWQCMRRTKKMDKATGKPTGGYSEWRSYSYHTHYEGAAAHIERDLIAQCGAGTFSELHRSAERIHAMTLETLKKAKLPIIERK